MSEQGQARPKVRYGALGVAAALFVFCAAASAQTETGRVIDRRGRAVGEIERVEQASAAQVMLTFARCFARQQENAVEAILRQAYLRPEQNDAVRRLVDRYERCLGDGNVQLRFQPPLLVGGMAEFFVTGRYAAVDISSMAAMSDEEVARRNLGGRNAYEVLALCIIRRDPAAVRSLYIAIPRSDAEARIFERLIPNLAPCVPADMQMTFGRSALRALLAAGTFRVLSNLASQPQ